MVPQKDIVDFYWDPVCPWCWITSRWMIDVGHQKQIRVNWKLFSLKIINAARNIPEPYKMLHEMGLKALRVAAAVRKSYGNNGLAKIYTLMGAHYHHDEEDLDTPEDLEKILQTGGYPTRLANAATDPAWDNMIRADMDQALAKVGKDVGVPLIVLDGATGRAFLVRFAARRRREKQPLPYGMRSSSPAGRRAFTSSNAPVRPSPNSVHDPEFKWSSVF